MKDIRIFFKLGTLEILPDIKECFQPKARELYFLKYETYFRSSFFPFSSHESYFLKYKNFIIRFSAS